MRAAPSGLRHQHPHRALGGTRILLAATPTTPPCFRHWRRSSSLQWKNYFLFAIPENLPIFRNCFFHSASARGLFCTQKRLPHSLCSSLLGLVIVFAAKQEFHVGKGALPPEIPHHAQQLFQQCPGLRVHQVVILAALVVLPRGGIGVLIAQIDLACRHPVAHHLADVPQGIFMPVRPVLVVL